MNTEQTNRRYFYVYYIYRYRNTKYEPNRLPIKILSLQCKRCLSFKVRQHNQQYFNLQYKACWVLYKKVGASSFFTIPLVHATTPTIHTNNPFLYFSHFSCPCTTSLLVHITILTIPTNTLFLYTSAIQSILAASRA